MSSSFKKQPTLLCIPLPVRQLLEGRQVNLCCRQKVLCVTSSAGVPKKGVTMLLGTVTHSQGCHSMLPRTCSSGHCHLRSQWDLGGWDWGFFGGELTNSNSVQGVYELVRYYYIKFNVPSNATCCSCSTVNLLMNIQQGFFHRVSQNAYGLKKICR